jgi:hypothetical protein
LAIFSLMALAFDLPFLQMLAYGAVFELHTSFLQSRVFSRLAGELTYTPRPAPGEIVFPESGPHNLRQGFNRLPEFSSRLGAQGYRIVQQAHFSPRLIRYAERSTSPPFHEKTQSGLTILDRHGVPIYNATRSARPSVTCRSINGTATLNTGV